MISSLTLRNWKSHGESTVPFGKGSNLLVGQMGSGKTSVLEGISFALFGTFPNLKNRKVSLEDVVMQKPKRATQAEASVELELGGKKYSVSRVISLGKDGAGSTEAFLREEGKLVEGPQTQRVTETVEGLLKVDYDLFSRTAYAEQNKIDYFVILPKADRKRQADELLGIDKFETVRANAGTLANRLKAMEAEAKSFLLGANVQALEKEFVDSNAAIEKLERDLEDLKKSAGQRSVQFDAAKKLVDGLEKEKRELDALQQELSAARALSASFSQELETKKNAAETTASQLGITLEHAKPAFELADANCAKKREHLSQMQKDAGESAGNARAAASKLEECKKKEAEREVMMKRKEDALKEFPRGLANEISEAKARFERLHSDYSACDAEISSLSKALDALHASSASCPVCGAALNEEHKKTLDAEKREALKQLDSKKSEALGQLLAQKKYADALEEKRAALSRAEERLAELLNAPAELDAAKNGLAQEESRRKTLEERANAANAELQMAEKELLKKKGLEQLAGELSSLSEKLERVKIRLATAERAVSQSRFSQAELDSARKIFNEASSGLAELHANAKAAENSVAEKKAFLKSLRTRLDAVRQKEKEAKALAEKAEALSVFQNAVIETQMELRETLVGAVNEAMQSMWQMLYPYADYSSLRLNAGDDYALELLSTDGNWTSIEHASGGEKSCASLSLRIAFAMVLTPNLSWLVLDEPTHNLDSEAVQRLVSALHDEIPKVFEQIFIITHDENLKEGANAKIYRVQRDKEVGGESTVEEITGEASA